MNLKSGEFVIFRLDTVFELHDLLVQILFFFFRLVQVVLKEGGRCEEEIEAQRTYVASSIIQVKPSVFGSQYLFPQFASRG